MRMRRKANLDERLEACRKTGRLIILNCEDRNFQTSVIEKEYLNIKGLFGNDNPAVMEIGAGKGQFACELARRNPDINVLAVERTSNVIVDAAEKAIAMNLPNLYLLRCDAQYLEKFIPEGIITRLYLNFSCPFPKKSYAAHRLTHRNFLQIYKKLLAQARRFTRRPTTANSLSFQSKSFPSAASPLKTSRSTFTPTAWRTT